MISFRFQTHFDTFVYSVSFHSVTMTLESVFAEETLRAIFTIPRHLRESGERVGRIIRDGEPLIVI